MKENEDKTNRGLFIMALAIIADMLLILLVYFLTRGVE